tara:strand:- start:280 stop:540 length:261 start_codon:yes stop_codon:yes gene_type:complete
MTKNIIQLLILLFIICFFAIVSKYYFSEKNVNLLKNNRTNLESRILKNISNLPVLPNDTNNVIEFNSGFENSNKEFFKRNFWDLFK